VIVCATERPGDYLPGLTEANLL